MALHCGNVGESVTGNIGRAAPGRYSPYNVRYRQQDFGRCQWPRGSGRLGTSKVGQQQAWDKANNEVPEACYRNTTGHLESMRARSLCQGCANLSGLLLCIVPVNLKPSGPDSSRHTAAGTGMGGTPTPDVPEMPAVQASESAGIIAEKLPHPLLRAAAALRQPETRFSS